MHASTSGVKTTKWIVVMVQDDKSEHKAQHSESIVVHLTEPCNSVRMMQCHWTGFTKMPAHW